MTPRDFCYWLQGFFEISEAGSARVEDLDSKEVEMIKTHLGYVFDHIQDQQKTTSITHDTSSLISRLTDTGAKLC